VALAEVERMGRQGLLIVYTGEGKGKTTAALGMLFRAWGHGFKIGVIQFIKSEGARWGEIKAAERLGIEWHTLGEGFVWEPENDAEARARAMDAWALAQNKIASEAYDLLILDEFTYPLHFGWIDPGQVVDWLATHRPPELHLVITGRNAPPELVSAADLVSEIRQIKHPFEAGVRAQKGIEF
jgi:cob(I)alamin adenosyltransferase